MVGGVEDDSKVNHIHPVTYKTCQLYSIYHTKYSTIGVKHDNFDKTLYCSDRLEVLTDTQLQRTFYGSHLAEPSLVQSRHLIVGGVATILTEEVWSELGAWLIYLQRMCGQS